MPGTETLKTAEKPNAGAAAGRGPAGGRGELEICVDAGFFPPELPISGAPSSFWFFFFFFFLGTSFLPTVSSSFSFFT